MSLRQQISTHIKQHGDMPFVAFMHQALYAPIEGYYSGFSEQFGVHGDFVTAPELTPLFGHTVANQCQQVLALLQTPILFEFGAGSGKLCVDILTQLERLNALPKAYHILEVSVLLQERQRALIHASIPHLADRITWLTAWPDSPFEGVVIANEVLDAMPVHRFLQTKDGLCEGFVSLNAKDELYEIFKPCTNARLKEHVQLVLPSTLYPYQSEANLFLEGWLKECSAMLSRGAIFLFDYGFPRHEYYHPDRVHGTLMCHYHHKAHTDPLQHIGSQDITAHVDFTHVAEAGFQAGFQIAGFTNQASFLLGNGLLSLIEGIKNERDQFRAKQAAKQLLQAQDMGELFKVMALTKAIESPWHGFQLHDKRASL